MLKIKNLKVKAGDKEILKGVNLEVRSGEIHVVMGPNGSGKSTLVNTIMGNPQFSVTDGEVIFVGKNIDKLHPEERAVLGLFMAFQYPRELSGIQLDQFLFLAYKNIMKARYPEQSEISVFDFKKLVDAEVAKLNIKPELIERSLNKGFSGGEKKKVEMLQLAILQPTLALLDETDSGLDVDALRIIGEAVNRFKDDKKSLIIVTHYQRILDYVKPDKVHIMIDGRIVQSGGPELVKQIEKQGYERYINS